MRIELATNLERNATKLLTELWATKEPILIFQNGTPCAYLVDYESFNQLGIRVHMLEGMLRGEQSVEQGRTLTHEQAKARFSRWLDEEIDRDE